MVSLPSSIIPRRHPIAEGIDRYMARNDENAIVLTELTLAKHEIARLNHENEELTEQLHTAKHELAIEKRTVEIMVRELDKSRARLHDIAEHMIDREIIKRNPVCDQAPD